MKKLPIIFAIIIANAILSSSCGSENREQQSLISSNQDESKAVALAGNAAADSISVPAPVSSTAAVENKNDTTHQFIRTAEIKCQVKDVITSTYKIEDIARRFNGFVTYTRLNSNIQRKNYTPINADSALETISFVVENTITIRVPNTELDTVLKQFAPLIDFMDYRIIKAEDVSIALRANRMAERRIKHHSKRLEKQIEERGKKLRETNEAEEVLFNREAQAESAQIANMQLQDQIDYSTIEMQLYQRQQLKRTLVENERNIEAYQPGIAQRLLEALRSGWRIVISLLLFFAHIWFFILLLIAIIIIYRKYLYKK